MTMIYRQAAWVRLKAEAEWCAAVILQRRLFFVESEAVGPAVHIHHRRIGDIRRPETETDDCFAITAKAPLRHGNATFPNEYAGRDRQMRPLGKRGANKSTMMIVPAPILRDGCCGQDNRVFCLRWFFGSRQRSSGRGSGLAVMVLKTFQLCKKSVAEPRNCEQIEEQKSVIK